MAGDPAEDGPGRPPRLKTTYGRRLGRPLKPSQRRLQAELLPRLSLPVPLGSEPLDLARLFGRAPDRLWIELGFGGGEHLAWQAAAHPDVSFIGAEFFMNGIASLLGHLERQGIGNVRILPDDGRPLLGLLPEAGVERAFILFPDPWPKRRHWRRRIVQPETLDALARILADGAELRIATDDPGYLEWILRHLLASEHFAWPARAPRDWSDRPGDWPPTRYEEKAVRAGREPCFLTFRRRARGAPVPR